MKTFVEDKDSTLQTLRQKVQQRDKLAKIKSLRKQIKKNRDTLNSIKKEDMQRLKMTLQRHNMNILNDEHSFDTILQKINYKVFTETNELNRLIQEEENLSKIYETKLVKIFSYTLSNRMALIMINRFVAGFVKNSRQGRTCRSIPTVR